MEITVLFKLNFTLFELDLFESDNMILYKILLYIIGLNHLFRGNDSIIKKIRD